MSSIRHIFRRLVTTLRGRRADADLSREIDTHLQLLEEKYIANGMSPKEARLAAKRAFGNVEQTKERQRDARSFRWLTGWATELRLGVRMLLRYPGLTVVGGLAMAFAILVGAGIFEVVKLATNPVLPLPGGEKIVGVTFWDRLQDDRKPVSSSDFLQWRKELTTLQDLGAFRLVERNLSTEAGVAEPVTVAEISPAAFRLTRVPPLLGRTLVEADGAPGSPAVVVIGHRLWQSRFGGDPALIGRTVQLGAARVTVAGVMPEGYAFPVDDQVWTPLRSAELSREPGNDALKVFARLADGASLDVAQAEIALAVSRAAAAHPDQYRHLTPQVLPFANSILWLSPELLIRAGVHSINAFAILLLIVICGNVALLILTRTATREREILVRTALGATRGRILAQLLLEALLLAALALAVGLAATNLLLKTVANMLHSGPERWPFWLNAGLSPSTVAYAGALTFVAALIVGVVPGMKVIGRGMPDRLRQSSAGAGGLRMGKVWTGLIVTQIAMTVLFTAIAYAVHRQAAYLASVQPVFPAANYLSVRLEMDPESDPGRFAVAVRELERRLAAEPSVAGVTVGDQLPFMAAPNPRAIEVEGANQPEQAKRPRVSPAQIAPNLLEVFRMPVIAGRAFDSRDLHAGANTVVINGTFADTVLAGRNAIGQRFRYESIAPPGNRDEPAKPGPWLEIVGVVRDLQPDAGAPLNLDNPAKARVYHTLNIDNAQAPLYLGVHVKGDPQSMGPRLRQIAGAVSPTLQLHDILPLHHAVDTDTRFWRGFADVLLVASAIVLFLSLAGIYAVTSYTVSRRTREIGVRVALGAPALRVVVSIFRRPLLQVAAGVAIGCGLLAVRLVLLSDSGLELAKQVALLLAYGAAVMAVCLSACVGPALRALRVDPVEALREDA